MILNRNTHTHVCMYVGMYLYLLFFPFLGNVLPRQVWRKKLFRACCQWQDCTIPLVYLLILGAQTALTEEVLFQITEAIPKIDIKIKCLLRFINRNMVSCPVAGYFRVTRR